MLDNLDFYGQFDYAPYVDLDRAGQRRWNKFMSGNLSWRHAVSLMVLICLPFGIHLKNHSLD